MFSSNEAEPTQRRRIAGMLIVAAILFAAAWPAFYQETFGTRISDIPAHFAVGRWGTVSVYSILYFFVHGLIATGTSVTARGWIAILLLSCCVALKGVLSFRLLSESKGLALSATTAIILAFAMPVFNWWNYTRVYLGQIAPNIWHNGTTILVMPVVVFLFAVSVRSLQKPDHRSVAISAALGFSSALIKPSYAIAWLPVFVPWFCFKALRDGASPRWITERAAIVTAPLAILILVQGLLVATNVRTGVIIEPFGVLSLYTPHPVISILLSLAFPLAVLILYRDSAWDNSTLLFAWSVFAIALLQAMLLAESGPRFSHGNFLWGAFMALYLLFLVSADVLLRQPWSTRSMVAAVFLALHFASGIYFYSRIVSGLGYF